MKKEETEDQRETRLSLDDERKGKKQFTKERLKLRTLYWHLNDID